MFGTARTKVNGTALCAVIGFVRITWIIYARNGSEAPCFFGSSSENEKFCMFLKGCF